jgi:uroporphyrin-III C-methyltransferase
MTTGKVYIVGSGCGTIEYLTVRAYQLLQQAEVLVYDALVEEQIAALVPVTCIQCFVGKRGGQPSPKQVEIDQLLVDYCQQGKQVVRLKSGDPFIFGRTTSEIQALRSAGYDYEIVPGISSALAAPLFAAIPLTDLVLSKAFTVVSCHDVDQLDWETLAAIDTLVILMGGRNLATIVDCLLKHHKSSQTAIAIIQWAGQPEQRIWTGSLADIVYQTKGESLSPCVMVIGEVVRLREFLVRPELGEDV